MTQFALILLQKSKVFPLSPDRSGNPFLSRFFFGSKKITSLYFYFHGSSVNFVCDG